MKNADVNDKLINENTTLRNRVTELETLVTYYEEQFRLAQHRRFGASSEKSVYDNAQLHMLDEVFNEAEVSASDVPEPELVEIEKHYRKRRRLIGDKLPDDLPVDVVEHTLPEDERVCPECKGTLHAMGRETRRELVIVPAQVKIREHIRYTYSCRRCENENVIVPIIKADVPVPVIKGSFASPEAIAHIMTQKFVMAVPLYRQEQEWHRQGIQLSRQTMSNWLIRCAEDYLTPIYERMKALLLKREVLHGDETTLRVINEQGKETGGKSYMWLYRTSGDTEKHIVLYDYRPDRRAAHPKDFLADFNGYLHADGYDGYHSLPEGITVVGCWAHLRRKFDEALKSMPEPSRNGSDTMRGKRYCDKLFELEKTFAGLSYEDRYERRLEKSEPLMDQFFAWADKVGREAAPKGALGKAVYYAASQRVYLERYLLDGKLEISNNRAERSIKPFVIGRKNWLFSNTAKGAKASAVIYSIIETAKENGVNPFAYLVYIFNNAPNIDIHGDADALDSLLPWAAPDSCRERIQ